MIVLAGSCYIRASVIRCSVDISLILTLALSGIVSLFIKARRIRKGELLAEFGPRPMLLT